MNHKINHIEIELLSLYTRLTMHIERNQFPGDQDPITDGLFKPEDFASPVEFITGENIEEYFNTAFRRISVPRRETLHDRERESNKQVAYHLKHAEGDLLEYLATMREGNKRTLMSVDIPTHMGRISIEEYIPLTPYLSDLPKFTPAVFNGRPLERRGNLIIRIQAKDILIGSKNIANAEIIYNNANKGLRMFLGNNEQLLSNDYSIINDKEDNLKLELIPPAINSFKDLSSNNSALHFPHLPKLPTAL